MIEMFNKNEGSFSDINELFVRLRSYSLQIQQTINHTSHESIRVECMSDIVNGRVYL